MKPPNSWPHPEQLTRTERCLKKSDLIIQTKVDNGQSLVRLVARFDSLPQKMQNELKHALKIEALVSSLMEAEPIKKLVYYITRFDFAIIGIMPSKGFQSIPAALAQVQPAGPPKTMNKIRLDLFRHLMHATIIHSGASSTQGLAQQALQMQQL